MSNLRVALAQINVVVGDLDGNAAKITDYLDRCRELAVDLVLFPELTLTGYPPEDLLLKPQFVDDSQTALRTGTVQRDLLNGCHGIIVFINDRQ